MMVRARVPEKQGLKLILPRGIAKGGAVRARVPEKQGLKRIDHQQHVAHLDRPGASSRKTRIETMEESHITNVEGESGREFQKNKD